MYSCIVKNLTIIGNCIGLTQDLRNALADYSAERLPVVVDSVYQKDDAAPFLRRTFADPDRFGKVVFRYDT